MKNLIANARVLDETKIDTSKILLYSIVKIKNISNKVEMSYTIVPESEADIKLGKISVTSPIASALLGKQSGDKITVDVPAGKIQFEILNVSR